MKDKTIFKLQNLKTRSFIYKEIWESRKAYLFLSPLFIGLIIFVYYPPISGLYHAFFNWDAVGKASFIGLNNFKELFKDQIFINSFPVMLKLLIPRLIIGVTVPLIMAEVVFAVKNPKWNYAYRVLLLLPMITPGVVGMLIWGFIYDPINGLATFIAKSLRLLPRDGFINWLGDPRTVIPSIIFMGFPWIGGTSVLIYMAGLMNVPTEIMESSVLDGASTLKRIWNIDIPLLIGQIRYFLIFGIIGGLQDYGVQIVLTHGGPGYSTIVPGYYMFIQAFISGRMGYACAIGTILFLIIFILTILTYRYVKYEIRI
jgi:ABC-type sugar transport system permease subunit